MKNQASKFALGLALLAVWGLLGFRVYQKFGPSEFNFEPARPQLALSNTKPAESFQLLLDYRDPFSGRQFTPTKKASNPAAEKPKAVAPKAAKPAPPSLPTMVYKGNMALRNGRQAALMRIDNQLLNLGEGETYEEVKLLMIYDDSVRVDFKGQQKTITKVQE